MFINKYNRPLIRCTISYKRTTIYGDKNEFREEFKGQIAPPPSSPPKHLCPFTVAWWRWVDTERFISYRKYILQTRNLSQYRYTQLQYRCAIIFEAPSTHRHRVSTMCQHFNGRRFCQRVKINQPNSMEA